VASPTRSRSGRGSQAVKIKTVNPSVKMNVVIPLLFAMEFPPSTH
jgi:hypothetical protein